MSWNTPLVPARKIVVSHDRADVRGADIVATYRTTIAQNADKLAKHGFKQCTPRIHDLSLLVAAVSHADRAIARWAHVWRRNLMLVMPVYELDFWRQPHVVTTLSRLLSPLTGDAWAFEFKARRDELPIIASASLPLRRSDLRILPYSHGLDSFALRALELESSRQSSLILLTSGDRPPGLAEFKARYGDDRIEHLNLPLHTKLDSGQNRETSNRSRAFVFGVAASIAAYFSESRTVLVAEAGQGTLGPWLDAVGTEIPDIRTHPLFTRRLERFIKLVLGHDLNFLHPRLWSTKGQTLKEVVRLGLHGGWETTFSCADRRKLSVLSRKRVNCGACAACLLRRVSLRTAGLDHNPEPYLWPDLSADSLAHAAHPCARAVEPDDTSLALGGIAAMQRLADRAAGDLPPTALFELSQSCGIDIQETGALLARVAGNHRTEWESYCDNLGPKSFVNTYRIRLQARRA